jgi:hypothetical protein
MLQESPTGQARINVSRRHHTMDTPRRQDVQLQSRLRAGKVITSPFLLATGRVSGESNVGRSIGGLLRPGP